MNVLAPLVRPVFAWNHASLMREGGHGFVARLGTATQVTTTDEQHGPRPAAVAALAVTLVLVARAVRRRR
jgi:MYXO-CTERM domain-containing protein